MAVTIDLAMAEAVKAAVEWHKFRPERDGLDAAYAAIMNAPKAVGAMGGKYDAFGRGDQWIAFLAAVRAEIGR